MPERHNEQARLVGRAAGMAPVAATHTPLAHVAGAFTTVPGAHGRSFSPDCAPD